MYAKITIDHLNISDTLGPEYERRDLVVVGTEPDGPLVEARLYDDDGELYYTCEVTDDEALEALATWGMVDSGTTRLDVKRDGEWVMEIA